MPDNIWKQCGSLKSKRAAVKIGEWGVNLSEGDYQVIIKIKKSRNFAENLKGDDCQGFSSITAAANRHAKAGILLVFATLRTPCFL